VRNVGLLRAEFSEGKVRSDLDSSYGHSTKAIIFVW
jgi:hypothetical protein